MGPLKPPTPRQVEILRFVEAFLREHGRPPTHKEIGTGTRATGVAQFLDYLKRLGLLTWQPTASGTLEVTEAGLRVLGL
jgi:SOS-response transcriptional repressor LexA